MKRFKNKGPKIKDTTKIRLGGLFKTIFLTAILCMAIPVFIVSFTTINSVRDELAETSDTNLTQIATEKDNQISAMIEDQIEIAQTLANTPFIVESVSEKVSANNTDIDYDICDYLKTIADSRDGLYENLFVTAGTMFIADSHDGETAHDVSEETSYQTCIANGGYVGKELSPTSGLPVLIIDMPITDPDTGEIIGTVGNAMALSVLTESMMNSFGEGSDYSVYMLDSEGVVIASANEDDILNLDFTTENDTTAAVMEQIAAEETGTVQFSLAGVSNKGAYSTSNGMTTLVYMSTTAYMKSIEHMIANIVIIAGVCVVIAVIVITIVSTWIIKPMSQMVSLIEKYGDADFSSEVPAALIRRKDEIGTLGKSMDKMQKVIKEIFENIINETERVSGNVNDSKGEMTELAGRIGTVNDLVSDRAAESEETAASTEIISENALSVKDAVVEITEQTQKGMEMSDDINERASELKSDAVKAQDEVTRLTSELRDKLNDAVEQSKAVNQINALSDAILDIASETSLLSLNASIEAARAGEAGRGFAVVAEQIGKLADNSQKSAVQIQDITGQVVIAVNNLADNSLDAIRFIDENIMSDYQSMVDTGENYYNDAMSFRGLMENINGKADMLMDSIGAMTNSVGEISTANMEGAEGITNISHNTADIQNMSVRVSDIMDSVQDSTVKLKETVNKLTV